MSNTEGATAPDANASPEVVAPADAGLETKGSEAESSPAAADTGDQPAKELKGVGKRIDELTRLRREAERREAANLAQVERLTALVERLAGGGAQQQRVQQQRKTLADFGGDERAFSEHVYQDALTRARTAADQRVDERFARENAEARRAEHEEHAQKFAESVEDYDEVANDPTLPITPDMADAILDYGEDAPAIQYYLGNNRDIARKIAKLSPARAGKEIAKIADRLALERTKAKDKPVTKAPPPPPRVEGADASVRSGVRASDPASDKLPTDEWIRAREREIRARRQ